MLIPVTVNYVAVVTCDSWNVERCVSWTCWGWRERPVAFLELTHCPYILWHKCTVAASNWPVCPCLGGCGLKIKSPSSPAVLASQAKQLCLLMALWLQHLLK